MIPEELLATLGALTVEFAQLDEAVTDLVSDLMRCDDFEVAWTMVAPLDFSRKLQKGRELLTYYTEKFGIGDEAPTVEALSVLNLAETLGARRSEIIHSHVHFSLDGSKHIFKHHRKGTIDASESAVSSLVRQTGEALTRCLEVRIGLNHILDRKYAEFQQD